MSHGFDLDVLIKQTKPKIQNPIIWNVYLMHFNCKAFYCFWTFMYSYFYRVNYMYMPNQILMNVLFE